MSVYTSHYIGFYLKCSQGSNIELDIIEPASKMFKIFDITDSELFENFDFYIPSVPRPLCYNLDEDSSSGILEVGRIEFYPDWFDHAYNILSHFYEKIEPCYGIITHSK